MTRIAWCLFALPLAAIAAGRAFVPDFKIQSDDYTVLMAVDATLTDGLGPFQSGGHGKFFVQGWKGAEQQAAWTVTVDDPADYEVNVLARRHGDQSIRLEVTAGARSLTGVLPQDTRSWQRVRLEGTFPLAKGSREIVLRLLPGTAGDRFAADVHAIELVRPAVRELLHEKALRLRADTGWFQEARYGIMVHWTAQSMPSRGDRKPYDRAVAEFDVEAFADQVRQTGAGFLLFTTSHALQYFPAPIRSLEAVLPGRTSQRDLVAALAAALAERGVRLMLYYHLGAVDDPDWLEASGFWETDTTRFFGNWQAIVGEVGRRYGEKLAGWWFDDGSTNYYYRSAPWERLTLAAKAGNSRRLVAFNAWELNSPTEFHDFFTGEGFEDPRGQDGLLAHASDGRYPSGTHQGLQGSACLITEGDWGHFRKDAPLGKPRWNVAQLTEILQGFLRHRNVPIFNLEITQEGQVSPESIELFRQASDRLPPRR